MQAVEAVTTLGSAESELIEGLKGRIEAWRGSETRGRAMPEELWEEAGAAAQLLGVFRVAKALALNYETLKRRAGGLEGERTSTARADFIELPALNVPVDAGDDVTIEVTAADGARLSVRGKAVVLNVAALIGAFRGRA